MNNPIESREAQWQAQAEAAERSRSQAPLPAVVQRYRLVLRALRQPLGHSLPADFASQVMAQVDQREKRSAVEDALVTVLLVGLALAGLMLTWPYLQPVIDQIRALPVAGAVAENVGGNLAGVPWGSLLAVLGSVGVALLLERGLAGRGVSAS